MVPALFTLSFLYVLCGLTGWRFFVCDAALLRASEALAEAGGLGPTGGCSARSGHRKHHTTISKRKEKEKEKEIKKMKEKTNMRIRKENIYIDT